MSGTVFPVGQTDVTLYFWAWNADNSPRTDLTHTTAGLSLGYVRERAAEVVATVGGSPAPAALAADTTAHTDWGFRTVYANLVRVDYPDAAFIAGSKFVIPFLALSGAYFTRATLDDLSGGDPRAANMNANVTQWRGVEPNILVSGRVDGSVGAMAANVMTAAAAAPDLTTELQSGLATAAALTTVDNEIAVIDGIVDTLLARVTAAVATAAELATVDANIDTILSRVTATVATAAALTTVDNEIAIIDGIVDTLLSRVTANVATAAALTTVDTNVNTLVTRVPSAVATATDLATVDANIDTLVTRIPAAVATASALATVDSEIGVIDGIVDTLLSRVPASVATAADLATVDANVDTLVTRVPSTVPTAVQTVDALLGRRVSGGADGGRTVAQALASLRNRVVIAGGTLTVYDVDDTTILWTSTITGTPAITESDPV